MTSGVVTGVIRSTIELGNRVWPVIHSASPGCVRSAYAVNACRATSPLPSMLSHDTIVGDGRPRSRRRASASVDQAEDAVAVRALSIDVVAALGDRQRDDPGARRGEQFDDGLAVVGRIAVVDDRADDPRRRGCRRGVS